MGPPPAATTVEGTRSVCTPVARSLDNMTSHAGGSCTARATPERTGRCSATGNMNGVC